MISTKNMQYMLIRNSRLIYILEDLAVMYKSGKDFKAMKKVKKDIAKLALVQRELKVALRRK